MRETVEPQHLGDDDGSVTTAPSPEPVTTAPSPEDVGPKDDEPVRYEIVFDCRDRTVGSRLVTRIVDAVEPTFEVVKGEEGPTWSVTVSFPSPAAADGYFASDLYRQFCIEVRRSAHSSVLVVPLGTQES